MKNRFLATATLVLCCSALFAKTHTAPEKPKACEPTCEKYRRPDVALCNVPPAYNVPARITNCSGKTFEIEASYLYWNISQEFMAVGQSAVYDSATGAGSDGLGQTVVDIPHQYTSGFRAGIGSGTNFDDWQVRLEYTYLHRTKTFNAGSNATAFASGAQVIVPSEWFIDSTGTDGKVAFGRMASTWKMNFDELDLSLGRPYYLGQRLTINPYTGLLGIHVAQTFDIDAYLASDPTGDPVEVTNSSTAWAIGPQIGANFHWLLGSGFRFEADAQYGLLYTDFTNEKYSQTLLDDMLELSGEIYSTNFSSTAYLRSFYDLSLGLGWGMYFSKDYHFDLLAAYEFVSYEAQNVMRKNVSELGGFAHPAGNLQFHGLTVTARFDF